MHEIKEDLKAIRQDVHQIKTTLATNTVSLQEHMRRTTASESRITSIENKMLSALAALLITILGAVLRFGFK